MSSITVLLAFAAILLIIFYKKKSQMGKTWEGGIEATVSICDKDLTCLHCSYDKFSKVEGLLTTSYLMFFNLAFWNRSAACFICKRCGFIHWFLRPKEKANIEILSQKNKNEI